MLKWSTAQAAIFKNTVWKWHQNKIKTWRGNIKNLWSIHWDHLQLCPISWDYPFKGLPSFSHRKLYNIYTYNQESFISLRVSAPADLFSPPPFSPLLFQCCSSAWLLFPLFCCIIPAYTQQNVCTNCTIFLPHCTEQQKKKNSTFDSVFCLLECLDFGIFENFEKFLHKICGNLTIFANY